MSLLGSFPQQVGEVMDYYIDYAEWFSTRKDKPLESGFNAVVEPGVEISEFSVDPVTMLARVVVDSTASEDGIDCKVTVWLTTTTGIVKEDDFVVKVRET